MRPVLIGLAPHPAQEQAGYYLLATCTQWIRQTHSSSSVNGRAVARCHALLWSSYITSDDATELLRSDTAFDCATPNEVKSSHEASNERQITAIR